MSVLNQPVNAIRREWSVFTGVLLSPAFQQLLRWCLPALLLGAVARLALNLHFPYGYFQPDTPDFLVTAQRFIKNHGIVIHGKKSFLAPICFAIPFLLHIPALIIIPIVQHLAGLVATLFAGGLVRFWFRFWRWFVIPVTIAYTLNPALLWYEHAMLAECHYLFCITALALSGTLLVRRPTLRRFICLIVALFFTAGSRPEGKLFVAFGIGVVALAYLGADWKLCSRRIAVILVASAGIWMCSRSTQAGLLLYATVLPLTPDTSTVAPGIEPFVASLRTEALAQDPALRSRLTPVEKAANDSVRTYLKSLKKRNDDASVNALAQRLAVEAMRHKPQLLLPIAANKFLMTCRRDAAGHYDDTSGGYTPAWIYGLQTEAWGRREFLAPLVKGLTGQDLHGDAQIDAFIHAHYVPLSPDWFRLIQVAWSRATLGWQLASQRVGPRDIPGWPAFWLLAAAGMLASLIPRDSLWRFHLPWIAAFLGVWLAVMLTGVVNARYRFAFEPFCMLYAFLLLDFLWSAAASLANLRRAHRPASAAPVAEIPAAQL